MSKDRFTHEYTGSYSLILEYGEVWTRVSAGPEYDDEDHPGCTKQVSSEENAEMICKALNAVHNRANGDIRGPDSE